jgi:hypothetical protein
LCAGDWFGYVTPDHIQPIIDHVAEARNNIDAIIPNIWRGRLGLTKDQVLSKVNPQ